MKKRTAVFLVLLLLMNQIIALGHWADSYFSELQEKQIMIGDELGFRGDDPLLRCEFSAMLNRAFSFMPEKTPVMADVHRDDWYYSDFQKLCGAGIIQGDELGNIKPLSPITRAEMAVMLARALKLPLTEQESLWEEDIPSFAYSSVLALMEKGIVSGYPNGSFGGNRFLTRGEAAAALSKALALNEFSGGDGSAENPYKITEAKQLVLVNKNLEAFYSVEADLNFLEQEVPVIGTEQRAFNGHFNGNGHKLIVRESAENANILFRKVGKTGVVDGIRLVCPYERFSVASVNEGRIRCCSNTTWNGEIQDYVRKYGGIAQINYGDIEKCYNGSLVVKRNPDFLSGGIAGENIGSIRDSFNFGNIHADCGGIAGENSGEIADCYTTNGDVFVSGNGTEEHVYSGENAAEEFFAAAFSAENGELVLKDFAFFGNEDYVLYAGGDGSAQNPYRIETEAQFQNIAQNPGKQFVQTKNLVNPVPVQSFLGVYNGNGFSISGVRLTGKNQQQTALFEENSGELIGVRLLDALIKSDGQAGGIVSQNSGLIRNCSFNGLVSGENAGGICYANRQTGRIENCFSTGQIMAGKSAAGICTVNYGTVLNTYTTSEVLGATAGGLVRDNKGEIRSSYFAGKINPEFGGVAYYNYGLLWGTYAQSECALTADYGKSSGVAVRDTVQMLYASAYPSLNFASVWNMPKENGYRYPTLRENPHTEHVPAQNIVQFSGGNGTVIDPYRIVTPMQLENVNLYPDANFILMNDLDLTDMVAKKPSFCISETFNGIFNGNGKTIKGYSVAGKSIALFSENNGTIERLYIDGGSVSGQQCAGFVVKNNGTIQNCAYVGKLNGNSGGIAFLNNGYIAQCATGRKADGNSGAGIVLENKGIVRDCYSTMGLNTEKAYGIACGADGRVENSWFGGYITAKEMIPLTDGLTENSFYLNFYASSIANGKTIEEAAVWAQTATKVWTEADGLPVLPGLPVMELPAFTLAGNGAEDSPFIIANEKDLKFLGMYADKAFRLTRNLYFKEEKLHSVAQFSGTLDGNGMKISGFQISDKNSGLIGVLTGRVRNLTLEKFMVEGTDITGGIAALNQGTIENCSIRSGRIGTSGSLAGGIAGENRSSGVIYNCANGGDVFSAGFSGGIAGKNTGTLAQCRNTGGVVATAQADNGVAGGIAGETTTLMDKCYNNGKILSYSESGASYSGGICGAGKGTLLNCYNTGEINAKAKEYAYSGGICGFSDGTLEILSAYNTGFTNATAGKAAVGSAMGRAFSGRLRGFVYEHTLSVPVGEGDMREEFVAPRSADVMMRKEGFKGFDFDKNWTFLYTGSYYYPQLTQNLQTEIVYAENLAEFAGGDGSLENPYKIMTPEQLNNVRKYLGSTFMLLGDIDMANYCQNNEFLPIGDNVFSFFGLFVGNNYCISGLSFAGSDFGLFRENHGEIYNCMFERATGAGSGGVVAAYNTGLIYNCVNLSDMKENQDALNVNRGGLVGVNKGTGMIISSYNMGNLQISGENVQTGGVAYGNYGIISGSFHSGSIAAQGAQLSVSGGIAAYNFGVISDCYTSNSLSAHALEQGESFAGGIAGNNGGTVVNCYYSGSEEPAGKKSGSIAATNTGTMVNCYYHGASGYAENTGSIRNVRQCTLEELRDSATFEGFDFENMWIMDPSFKYKYPQFIEIAHREKE